MRLREEPALPIDSESDGSSIRETAAKVLEDEGGIVFAYLFGSAASGGLGARSDLVVLNSSRSLTLRRAIVRGGILLVDRDPDRRLSYEASILHDYTDFMYSMELANDR
jgi:predicted nucleotidyltransferase